MGSEDFAFYLDHAPGCMFRLGCASPAVGNHGLHSARFDIDEQALAIGAMILAEAAIRWSDPTRILAPPWTAGTSIRPCDWSDCGRERLLRG